MPMRLPGGAGKGRRNAQYLCPGLGIIAKQMGKPHVIANRHTNFAIVGFRHAGRIAGTECFAFAVAFPIGQIDIKHMYFII